MNRKELEYIKARRKALQDRASYALALAEEMDNPTSAQLVATLARESQLKAEALVELLAEWPHRGGKTMLFKKEAPATLTTQSRRPNHV